VLRFPPHLNPLPPGARKEKKKMRFSRGKAPLRMTLAVVSDVILTVKEKYRSSRFYLIQFGI